MESYSGNEFFNVGTGCDVTITELSLMVKNIVGYKGVLVYDKIKPDGMPQKLRYKGLNLRMVLKNISMVLR